MEHFLKTSEVEVTNEQLFRSILNIPLWWTEIFKGTANQPGDTFTVFFGPSIFKTMKVEEVIPNQKIVWNVVDAYIDIPELNNKSEWTGTKIIWEISPTEHGSELRLEHIGLTPRVECYSICESGWNNFLQSLISYATEGTGTPYKES